MIRFAGQPITETTGRVVEHTRPAPQVAEAPAEVPEVSTERYDMKFDSSKWNAWIDNKAAVAAKKKQAETARTTKRPATASLTRKHDIVDATTVYNAR
jgi:hypothetical protein